MLCIDTRQPNQPASVQPQPVAFRHEVRAPRVSSKCSQAAVCTNKAAEWPGVGEIRHRYRAGLAAHRRPETTGGGGEVCRPPVIGEKARAGRKGYELRSSDAAWRSAFHGWL